MEQSLHEVIIRTPINPIDKSIDEQVFNEALYLSSPVLFEEYQKHLSKPLEDPKELKKLNISLYKYQSRASTRCTPFGLFAGLGIGKWHHESEVVLNHDLQKELKRKTRLDMNVLCTLAQEISKTKFVKPFLKFFPNTSIYLVGDNYRYVEYYYQNNRRFHKINKVDFSEYLQYILDISKAGLIREQLVTALVNREIEREEADFFINELISEQLLVSQLEPTVIGPDYFDILLSNLSEISTLGNSIELSSLLSLLRQVDLLVKATDEKFPNEITAYRDIHRQLKTILHELSETNLFQTDLYKTTEHSYLSTELRERLQETICFLNKITPEYKNPNIEEFKKRFLNCYEDAEVPLLIALDTETGIGYPSKDNNGINSLIEDIFIQNNTTESDIKWNLLESCLLRLITDSIKYKKHEVEIDERDFQNIDYSSDAILPTSYSIMFKVLNATTGEMEIGTVSGSSAINLLGRFAGGDRKLESIVKRIANFEQEQEPSKIIAEIAHLPESRTGNVIARPQFRPYEIPYLAKSLLNDVFQIKMEDLLVKIRNNKIILFDKRLGKEIIPRLGNAHNYQTNSLPLYHFLCDLQTQYFNKQHIGFSWGVLAGQFDFLPRVKYKSVILSVARWKLNKAHLIGVQEKLSSQPERIKAFFTLKGQMNLPDRFLIVDGDNELLIDTGNDIAVETFIDMVKNRSEVILEEFLFNSKDALVKDTLGNSYTNECLAVFLNDTQQKTPQHHSLQSKNYTSKQVFPPGSEWVYYKIYCGAKTADYILSEKIKYITEMLVAEEVIDLWFFIRYADPDVHLRLRLHVINFNAYSRIFQLLNEELAPLMDQRLISTIQTDTYRRELERYGDVTIGQAEELFFNDSVFVTNMLNMLDNGNDGPLRWLIALRSVDELLNDFKLKLDEKYLLIDKLSIAFFKEHGEKKELKLLLDAKFRAFRKDIESLFEKETEQGKEYYPLLELIKIRSEANINAVKELLCLNSNKKLSIDFNDLLASLLHMNLDRLFMGRNRTNEFVVYDLLARYYKSKIARLKEKTKNEMT